MLETQSSMSPEQRSDATWASAGYKLAQANATERLIEAKERELQQCIVLNYSKVREVEKELATLQFQLKLTSGPKRSALEMFRKKIEAQNACVLAARERHRAAKKAFESTEEALRAEERVKDQLCQELNLLVQQSAHAQIEKLESLTQRLEYLNQGMHREPSPQKARDTSRADAQEPAQLTAGVPASPARSPEPQPQPSTSSPAAEPLEMLTREQPHESQQQQQQQQEAQNAQRAQQAAQQRARQQQEQIQRSRQEATAARSNHVGLPKGGGSAGGGVGGNAARQPGNRRLSSQGSGSAEKVFQGFE